MKISVVREVEKPTRSWSNRDLLLYFSSKMRQYYPSFSIPPVAWQSMLGRIKGFRAKLGIDTEKYKIFIDKVFEHFANESYTPVFGAIVSEKVFYVVQKLSSRPSDDKIDWVAYRDVLYNNLFFQKVV